MASILTFWLRKKSGNSNFHVRRFSPRNYFARSGEIWEWKTALSVDCGLSELGKCGLGKCGLCGLCVDLLGVDCGLCGLAKCGLCRLAKCGLWT